MSDEDAIIGGEGVDFRPARKSRRFRCLVLLAVVLLAGCIVLATLFAIEKLKSDKSTSETRESKSESFICDTIDCVQQAADILDQLNRTADPCDDFYEYACGGWIAGNPLQNNGGCTSRFDKLAAKNMLTLHSALTAAEGQNQSSALQKTINFYDTCLNVEAVEKRRAAPLTKLVQEFGGWSIGNGTVRNLSVSQRIGEAVRELGVTSLIGVRVVTDWLDATKHVVQLTSASIGMQPDDYLLNTTEHSKIRLAYQKYMKTIAKLLGGGNTSDSKMMAIYNFEKKLAMVVQGENLGLTVLETLEYIKSSGMDPADLNTTIEAFCEKTNFSVDFIVSLLDEVFNQTKFTKDDKVFAPHFPYFQRLATFISKELPGSRDVFADYVVWRIVDQFVSAMPQSFGAAKLEYMKAVSGGVTQIRWAQCIVGMTSVFPMPLGYLFVGKKFDEESKKVVTNMTKRIRAAFMDNLKNANWMDQSTKSGAREKAQVLTQEVGHPSWFNDTKRLDVDWAKLKVTDKLFENLRDAKKVKTWQNLRQVDKPVDVTLWEMSPATVNAYYDPHKNGMVILAGILQNPFYDPKRLAYLNYGAIGVVVGHEMSHGFDSQGRTFDEHGNFRDWWSKKSSQNYNDRARCLEEQYSKYAVYGKHINGNQTINENIADNGGVKLSYRAYQSWIKDNKPEGRLPGMGLTDEQLFFVSFAQAFCGNCGKTGAYNQIATDTHTYPKYRVIGSLSNFEPFSDAFKCRKGSRMNPNKKCAVW